MNKQQRKDKTWKEYEKIIDPALEEYRKICEEIDNEEETKCELCGK